MIYLLEFLFLLINSLGSYINIYCSLLMKSVLVQVLSVPQ